MDNKTSILTLEWQPVKHYKEIREVLDKTCGVYIWGFKKNDRFAPYYVGKGANIGWRLCEHIASLVTGAYTIYEALNFPNSKIAIRSIYLELSQVESIS